jgi:hypothetical protein
MNGDAPRRVPRETRAAPRKDRLVIENAPTLQYHWTRHLRRFLGIVPDRWRASMAALRAVGVTTLGLFVIAAFGLAGPAAAEAAKAPPSCAAINFRPVSSGLPDGDHEAGQYKSRYAKIVLMATVKGGDAKDYYLTFNGKRPAPLAGGVPADVTPCLRSKNITVPVKPAGEACNGSRFRVVIDNVGNQKTAMLFGLNGKEWRLCSAAKV